jgi:hypothetical protein
VEGIDICGKTELLKISLKWRYSKNGRSLHIVAFAPKDNQKSTIAVMKVENGLWSNNRANCQFDDRKISQTENNKTKFRKKVLATSLQGDIQEWGLSEAVKLQLVILF